MPRRRPELAALLLVTLVACGAPEVVTPPPGAPAEPSGAASTSATEGSARPRDIDVSGILTCELLTPAQLAEFRLDGEPRDRTSTDGLFGTARTCSVLRRDENPAISLNVILVVEYGIERFSEPGIVDGVRPIEIAGYPAVLSPPPPGMDTNCLVAVDVHPGQMVGVQLSTGGEQPPVPLDQLCADVPLFAEAVMQTLLVR